MANMFSVFFLTILCFHYSLAGDCMQGVGVERAFIVARTCYWIIGPENYTSFDTAMDACTNLGGTLAIIKSADANLKISAELARPAFFGYRRLIGGSWSWINDTYDYVQTFTDSGVHMALKEDGEWEATNMDAKGHIYDILCGLDQDPYLRCSDISVGNSRRNRNMPLYSGETIKFTCKNGFHVTVGITVQLLTCLPPNKWSFPARDCKPIQCDLIDSPAYTTRNSEDHTVGDSVIYTCTNNTWFFPGVDTMVFECKGTGEWTPSLRPCETIRCDPPPPLPMGELDTTVTMYLQSITYTCVTGYAFADGSESKTISCEGVNPVWTPQSTIDSLNCTQIFCPADPNFGEGTTATAGQSWAVGFYQVWWCWPGKVHPNGQVGTSTVCLKSTNPDIDHDWERPIPACRQVGCVALTVMNASTITSEDIYPYGYPVTYTCDEESAVFPGGISEMTVTCQADEQWDFSIPPSGCDASGCEDGWLEFDGSCYYVSNGRSLGLRYEYAEESCGYKKSSLVLIASEREAAWLATVTYDVYKRDFWIGYHANAQGEWEWKGKFSTNFTNFAEGYPEYYYCARSSVKGKWKDRNCDELLPYVCKKFSICGVAPEIANGVPVSLPEFPANVGEEVTYVCDDGYRFKEGSYNVTIKCEFGGFWSSISNCIADICPPLNTADREVHETWFDITDNRIGSVVTYTCQDGTLFDDGSRQKSIECLSGGVWSTLEEECEEFKCPKPASPDTTPLYGYDNWGDMDYYHCQKGYSFADAEIDKLFWCTRDGVWLPTGQTCIPRACPKHSLPFATTTPDEGVYLDVIVVECDHGYNFPDTSAIKRLTCTSDGVWSKNLNPCTPTKCEGPSPPEIEGTYRDTDVINSGTKVNYTCLDDKVYINGEQSRIAYCDYDTLQWLNLPTTCVDEAVVIKTSHSHPATEARNALTYGAVGLGVLSTLAFVIVLLDAVTIGRYCPGSNKAEEQDLTDLLEDVESRPPSVVKPRDIKNNENKDEEDESGSEYETDDEDENIPTVQL